MIWSPVSTTPLPLASVGVPAVLVRPSVEVVEVGVLVESVAETTDRPCGSSAAARAVLSTLPASTSAWVRV